MNKAIKGFFALLFFILTISGSLAAEKTNKPQIKTVDHYVAIFDFEVRTGDKDISRSLADSVIHEFSQSDKYEVIDRGNMNKILDEQKFQMSGCVAQECKVEAGQILGVGKIVNGSVGIVGKTYYLTLQLIDVKSGKVEFSAEDKCKCEVDELLDSTKRLAIKILGEKIERSMATAVASATGNTTIVSSDGRFEKLANGVVRDTKSGLEWYAGLDKNTSWDETKQWVTGLRVDGGDWRMPTLAELRGLYQKGAGSRNMTPLLETTGWWVWSGDKGIPPVEGRPFIEYALNLDLDDGKEYFDRCENSFYKRSFAVRSRK